MVSSYITKTELNDILQELPPSSCHMRLGVVQHQEGPGGLDKRSEDFILMPNGTQCAVAHPVKVCQSLLRFGSSDHH